MYFVNRPREAALCVACVCLSLIIAYEALPTICSPTTVKAPSCLLIVSFDGFRWDYLSRAYTPNFDRVTKEGVYVTQGLKNVFTTSTLTNHWSIVTGLYPESHGIVENDMYDPVIKKRYVPLYRNRFAINDPRFYDVPGVEPIWVANQLQKHGRSGSVMWWGAENAIKHVRPTYHMPLDKHENDVFKIRTIVNWFVNEHPINLGLLYFPEPDRMAHKYGPDSKAVTEQIARADELLGILLQELRQVNMLDNLNLILTSDHGFASTSRKRLIHLDDFIDPLWYYLVRVSPVATIIPRQGYESMIYLRLKQAAPRNHFKVFRKSEIPERLHYKNSPRVPAIVAIADLSWSFIKQKPDTNFTLAGNHGYDNEYMEMRPFFMAMGPSFKTGYKMDTFDSIDIYALMCHLLHLKPNSNNGTLTKVSQLLLSNDSVDMMWTVCLYAVFFIIFGTFGGMLIAIACRQHWHKGRGLMNQLKSSIFGSFKSSIVADNGTTVKLLSDEEENVF